MNDLVIKFPVKSRVLVGELAGMDVCPECGGPLDRSKSCNPCKTDFSRFVPARFRWAPPEQRG